MDDISRMKSRERNQAKHAIATTPPLPLPSIAARGKHDIAAPANRIAAMDLPAYRVDGNGERSVAIWI